MIPLHNPVLPALGVALLSSLLVSGPACAQLTSNSVAASNPVARVSRGILRSASGRFVIFGPDNLGNMGLVRWAREITGRAERTVGVQATFRDRVIHIVVDSTAERCVASEQMSDRCLIQRLVITSYDSMNLEETHEVLCRLLINGFILERVASSASNKPDRRRLDVSVRSCNRVPCWLSLGVAQHLFPALRARNSDIVLVAWEKGGVTTPADLLGVLGGSENVCLADKAACGLLVGWLASLPAKTERFGRIFRRLAGGDQVSAEWLAGCIPADELAADLDDKWDSWILRQKRIVYRPGAVTVRMVEQLQSELLISPGDSGISLSSGVQAPLSFRGLVDKRKSDWVPFFAADKAARLRIMAIGRGQDFGDVIESYCRFLECLTTRKSDGRLMKMLCVAEDKLAVLEQKLSASSEETRNNE